MLLLGRRKGESILVGNPVWEVKIVAVNRTTGEVTVGVEAPGEMRVSRAEAGMEQHLAKQEERRGNPG